MEKNEGVESGDIEATQDVRGERMDGGLQAWSQVFAAFWLWFNTWGLTNAFGVFQTYYQIKFPHQKPATISLIGSIQPFVLIFFGFLAGPLWDAGYGRSLIIGGSCLTALAYFMVSICDQYWQVMLAQGLLAGFGSCFLWLPSGAIIPQYFENKKALANGIAASGSGLGGVIYPIAFRQMLKRLSFGWSVRVLAFMILVTSSFSLLTIKPRQLATSKRKVAFEYKAFIQNKPYGLYTLALILTLAAQYTPAFFIQDYAVQRAHTDEELSSYLLPILNAFSVVGRIAPNIIADRIGGLNVLFPAMSIATILTFVWIAISTPAGCIIFASMYGFAIGCILSLPQFVIASLCTDRSVIGTRLGNAFAVGSFGLLLGPPVAAAILQSESGSWLGTQLFAGFLLALSSIALAAVRTYIAGLHLFRKV